MIDSCIRNLLYIPRFLPNVQPWTRSSEEEEEVCIAQVFASACVCTPERRVHVYLCILYVYIIQCIICKPSIVHACPYNYHSHNLAKLLILTSSSIPSMVQLWSTLLTIMLPECRSCWVFVLCVTMLLYYAIIAIMFLTNVLSVPTCMSGPIDQFLGLLRGCREQRRDTIIYSSIK